MNLKRAVDVLGSSVGLIVLAPLFLVVALLIWLEDAHNPLYLGRRVGRDGRVFRMVKFRSMAPRADLSGVHSTAAEDPRITRVGKYIRRYKLDEFTQLLNVFLGDMSLIGPRPQVEGYVGLYTEVERGLLSVRPGITDFSSIVFADEGDILAGSPNPDLSYSRLIRPFKSRLGLHYIRVRTLWLDLRLIGATVLSMFSRKHALHWVAAMLSMSGAPDDLVRVAYREGSLEPTPPPGADHIVRSLSA